MIERAKSVKDKAMVNFISDRYFENLEKCQLVDITIKIEN